MSDDWDDTIEHAEPPHPESKIAILIIFAGFLLALPLSLINLTSLRLTLLLGEILIIIPAGIYVVKKKLSFQNVFRLYPVDKSVLLVSFLLSLGVLVLSDELDRLVSIIIPFPPELEEYLRGLLQAQTKLDWVILIIATVFAAGILEEMLFRGMLLKALERVTEIPYAIFTSALIFATFHLNPFWFIQVMMLGLVLGYMAWRSNSVYPSIILHCSMNAFSLCAENTDFLGQDWYNWHGHVNPPILVIAAGISFYCFKWFNRLTPLDEGEETQPG